MARNESPWSPQKNGVRPEPFLDSKRVHPLRGAPGLARLSRSLCGPCSRSAGEKEANCREGGTVKQRIRYATFQPRRGDRRHLWVDGACDRCAIRSHWPGASVACAGVENKLTRAADKALRERMRLDTLPYDTTK